MTEKKGPSGPTGPSKKTAGASGPSGPTEGKPSSLTEEEFAARTKDNTSASEYVEAEYDPDTRKYSVDGNESPSVSRARMVSTREVAASEGPSGPSGPSGPTGP